MLGPDRSTVHLAVGVGTVHLTVGVGPDLGAEHHRTEYGPDPGSNSGSYLLTYWRANRNPFERAIWDPFGGSEHERADPGTDSGADRGADGGSLPHQHVLPGLWRRLWVGS